mgnify:CR=1 FL=1
MSKKKDRSLRLIKSHCNTVTNIIIDRYNMLEQERPAKAIAKVNQVTDLLLSIKNNEWLLNIIKDSLNETLKYIKENGEKEH